MFATTLALVACSADQPEPVPSTDEADALLEHVRALDYGAWSHESSEARAPHGAWADVYLDPNIRAVLDAATPLAAWPDGAAAVAEGRDAEAGELTVISVMEKRDGAWLWGQYDADDRPLAFGHPASCTACHGIGSDYLRSATLPVPPDE
jgi:hypothetical protein